MPVLRFARDKRGYETTSLVHSFRRRGRPRQRILYWFRTPPDVKVGRAALDEEAIRWIEEHNPDLTFDWTKILETRAPAPVPVEGKPRRGRQAKGEKTARQEPATAERPTPTLLDEVAPEVAAEADVAVEDLQAMAEALEPPEPHPTPETVVGHEQLAKLRGRFSELQARITERGGDPARIEALRLQAEASNPDTWVTAEDARKGLEEFEGRFGQIRMALGLRKRRRSRGGRGRRRRKAGVHAAALPESTLPQETGERESTEVAADSAELPDVESDEN